MKHNLINKMVVMFACALVITFAYAHSCSAEDLPPVQNAEELNSEAVNININEALQENGKPMGEETEILISDGEDNGVENYKPENEEGNAVSEEDISFLNEDAPADEANVSVTEEVSDGNMPKVTIEENLAPQPIEAEVAQNPVNPLLDVQPFPDNSDNLDSLETDVNKAQIDSTTEVDDVIPEIGGEKSPFESFGNAILSRVDNDLFNQMSNIEKQTTLLRLELKREELRSRVEALRNARLKAQQDEEIRLRTEEEKTKDKETERQALIIKEQERLKQKEIELEKVRQSKVLNDYMNEMLIINQKWVAKNAELQSKVAKLEEERKTMQQDYRDKLTQINEKVQSLLPESESAVSTFKRKLEALNGHINQLKEAMLEREDEIKQMSNPFSDDGTPGKDAIDMSNEYAIMDITGTGDDVIAKIVSRDGTTFIVHKGSMLKNGEVVTSITDHYISFENDGVQSYLYTGGTVMEYEPLLTFNGSDKTPAKTEKQIIKGDSSNVLGSAGKKEESEEPVLIKKPRPTSGNLSFGSGTFVQ